MNMVYTHCMIPNPTSNSVIRAEVMMRQPTIEQMMMRMGYAIFFFAFNKRAKRKDSVSGTQDRIYIPITTGTMNRNHPELLPVSMLTSCEMKMPITTQIDIRQNA